MVRFVLSESVTGRQCLPLSDAATPASVATYTVGPANTISLKASTGNGRAGVRSTQLFPLSNDTTRRPSRFPT